MTKHYDAIVIGTGQSGPALASRMGQEGLKVAIIERNRVGGTCVNVGCIPTKTLVGSARVAYSARQARDFGVLIDGDVRVDMKRVKQRKDEIAGASNQGVENWLAGMTGVDLFRGHGRFVARNQVEVNGEVLQAERIFIDVGARARVPDWPGLKKVPFMTNSEMMEVDFLPEHLVIVGGSYIGLEFAQMYRRFGSRVTVVETAKLLLPREDRDVADAIMEIMAGEGVEFRLGASCIDVQPHAQGVSVSVDCVENSQPVVGTHLLLAVGRVPNTHDLGLEHTGVETTKRGLINVDEQLRTNVDGIWAMGEVNGRGAFTHTSYNDYEIVAANLFDNDPRRVSDRILCYGLFIDPPLARIGMTEQQVRESGRPALIGKRMMTRVGRAKEFGDTRGFMKVMVDRETEQILGAAIIGMSGDEVIHCMLDVMYAKQPYTVISRAVHIHPTVTELIPTMLQEMVPLE